MIECGEFHNEIGCNFNGAIGMSENAEPSATPFYATNVKVFGILG
jgi:hypothetical protein